MPTDCGVMLGIHEDVWKKWKAVDSNGGLLREKGVVLCFNDTILIAFVDMGVRPA